jgi:hypothetical protein
VNVHLLDERVRTRPRPTAGACKCARLSEKFMHGVIRMSRCSSRCSLESIARSLSLQGPSLRGIVDTTKDTTTAGSTLTSGTTGTTTVGGTGNQDSTITTNGNQVTGTTTTKSGTTNRLTAAGLSVPPLIRRPAGIPSSWVQGERLSGTTLYCSPLPSRRVSRLQVQDDRRRSSLASLQVPVDVPARPSTIGSNPANASMFTGGS